MSSQIEHSMLFSGLDKNDIKLIEETGNKIEADKGKFIVLQGDPGDHFYLVLSGKVKVFKISPDGKEQILMIAGPGETFGEAALFAQKVYPANAEAIEKAVLVSFSREKFITLIHNQPTLAINMIGRLSMLLHHLTRLVQQLSLEDVSTRLASYIVGLFPGDEKEEFTIILTEKKMVLASILGTIPETLSRAFAKLTRLGFIAVDGQEIIIRDKAGLMEWASGQKN